MIVSLNRNHLLLNLTMRCHRKLSEIAKQTMSTKTTFKKSLKMNGLLRTNKKDNYFFMTRRGPLSKSTNLKNRMGAVRMKPFLKAVRVSN